MEGIDQIKLIAKDYDGSRAVLEDLFSVLGRDPELMVQLDRVEILDSYEDLLLAAISEDPLDPDTWWSKIEDGKIGLNEFADRLRSLDVSDQRANILFSRRLERVRRGGYEDLFLDLSRHLLAHRPNNHEAWDELGRMHEKRGILMKLGFVMINHRRSIQILHQGTGSNKGCLISLIEMKGLLGRNPDTG